MFERQWAGDNPFFLVVHPKDGFPIGLDLDFRGIWDDNAELIRMPGNWYLFRKADMFPCLQVHVFEGEQPYYTARHVGKFGSGGSREIIGFGIGKKLIDGSVMRLWVLPNGTVCGGEDLDDIGIELIVQAGPLPVAEAAEVLDPSQP